MDRHRWPEAVAKFVDSAECPRCSAPRDRILITVHHTEWLDLFGALKPKSESVPLPDWVVELAKEMR